MSRRARVLALVGGILGLVLSACGGPSSTPSADTRTAGAPASPSSTTAPGGSQPPAEPALKAGDQVAGLNTPWGLAALRDGTLLVSERDTAKIIQVDGSNTREVTTLRGVVPGGEGGLLGLAVSPDGHTVFAYYTAASDNRIVAMSWDGSTLGTPKAILTGIPKGGRHDGGRLLVGPDGYLYVGTGETGQSDLAQDKSSLGGKILRLTLDGKPAPGNPFDSPVWTYGHRNVEGLAFDDAGRLWASEFGDQTWDELNLITKGGNYGWPEVEGSSQAAGRVGPNLVGPKLVWRTSEASPSGLAYWQGELWMAALRGGRLWEIPLDGDRPGPPTAHFTGDYGRLRSVMVAPGGDALLLTASNTDGRGDPREGDDRILRVTRS